MKYRFLALAVLILLTASLTAPCTLATTATRQNIIREEQQWPWGNKTEPYPWLDYLASLTDVRGVTLTIVTRHESTILQLTKEKFLNSPVAQALGITNLIFLPLGPDLWESYIQRRIEKGTPIDVAWGGGPTIFNYIDGRGYVMSLNPSEHPEVNAVLYEASKIPEILAGSPTRLVGSDGYIHWIGAAISSFGITVNNNKLLEYGVPKPQRWIDLTKPDYAQYLPQTQLIGIADPTMSTSNTRMYEIVLQAYGWEEGWQVLTLMAANAEIFDSSSGVRDAVIRGDIAAGITIDFYGYTAMHQNPACEYIIPENESIINADPIAILKDTRYPVHAAAFVAWVLSEYGGQIIWLDPNVNRLPINARVFDLPGGQERQDLYVAYQKAVQGGAIQFNETLALATERAMQYYFKATLVNAHDVLQNVWAAMAQAYLQGKINDYEFEYLIRELGAPVSFEDPLTGGTATFTVQYAMKINDKLTQSEIANALLRGWEDAARAKYQKVYNDLQAILSGQLTVTPPTTTSPATTSPGQTTSTTPTGTTSSPSATQPTTTTATTSPAGGLSTQTIVTIVAIVILVAAIAVYLVIMRKK